jgi:periplasmic copper chaperone A
VRFFACVAIAFGLLCGSASAAPAIVASDAWSRPAIGTGVVYVRIVNHGATADRLDAARSTVARTVELHRSMDSSASMNGMKMSGVMSMERVAAVTIPAHGSVTLAPGGYHLMAIGLHHDLHANERFAVQLHFKSAGWMTVTVRVRPI